MLKRVGLVASSWRGWSREICAGAKVLRDANVEVVWGGEAKGRPRFNSPFGRESERLAELLDMLRNPDVDTVWIVDGGAGASTLLSGLRRAWNTAPWDPHKVVIGYSDACFLLVYLAQLGHLCFVASGLTVEQEGDEQRLAQVVSCFQDATRFKGLVSTVFSADVYQGQNGEAHGTLWGGAFSVLRQMLGTPYAPSFADAIVFFEEHGGDMPGQREYLLWEQLQGIALGGWWEGATGFCIGDIVCQGPYESNEDLFPPVYEVLDRMVRPMTTGPVVGGLPCGELHMNLPIPIGVPAHLLVHDVYATLAWELPEWALSI